ncbi:MAG: hypothetical protein ABI579_06050 [Candidatus Sumerlaeota bacterium]
MQTPAYRRASAGKTSKYFRLDFRKKKGTQFYFGTTNEKSPNKHPHFMTMNAAWFVTGAISLVALAGWLLGWPVMMMVTLWFVVVVLLTTTVIVEKRMKLNSQDIVIDSAHGTVTLPATLPGLQGTYRMEDLILGVHSDTADAASTVVTRDYYVVIEGESERDGDTTKRFEVKIIGPGYLPEMNDEADELRHLGRWRYQRFEQ